MSASKFLHNAGLAALAAALVVTALPASAQDRGDLYRAERDGGERAEEADGSRPNNAFEARAQQAERRSEQRAAPVDRGPDPRAAQIEHRGDRGARQSAGRSNWGQARQIDPRSEQAVPQAERRGDFRADQVQRRGPSSAGWVQPHQRNRTYTDPNRNRPGNSSNWGDGRDNDGWRDDSRYDGRRDNDRWGDNNRGDSRQWDRRWRGSDRYDWQRYRNSNRIVFSVGSYYSPYRNYSYRRYGIGGRLDQLFYSDRYWLNDPWRYRLPAVYGPYRWVRYYDDVLLVDIYRGEVVDVIHDFFW